jgi:glycosyltransferase involved in cell wall biosynthesis
VSFNQTLQNTTGTWTNRVPLVFWDGYGLSGNYSGIITHASSLAEALAQQNIKPVIVGELGIKRHFPNVEMAEIPNRHPILRINRAKLIWSTVVGREVKRLASGRSHILHGLSNFNIPLEAPSAFQRRVLTVHDVIPLLDPAAVSMSYYLQFKAVISRAVNVADRIICVSNWTLQCLLTFFPHIEDKCLIIYNGIKEKSTALCEKDPSVAVEVLSVARYEKYKRLDMLVNICRKLPNNYTLNVVTDQRGRDFCERLGGDLIAKHRLCVYVGVSAQHLGELYRKSHVYLHPSLYEGFNIPAVEALVNGIPVVHCKGIGTEEFIGPEVGVSLSANDSVDHWIAAVHEAVEKLRSNLWSLQLRSAIEKLPTWSQNAAKTTSIYRELS